MSDNFQIRLAAVADLELISWHRARMFRDMGELPPDLFESFRVQSLETLQRMFDRGEYVGWLASPENEPGQIVAGAGLQLREIPPHPQINPNGKIDIVSGPQAIIQNVFTEPEWRRRGLAALLIERIIDWTHEQGIDSLVLTLQTKGALFMTDSDLPQRPRCDSVARVKRLRRWRKVAWPFVKDAAARAWSVNIVVV